MLISRNGYSYPAARLILGDKVGVGDIEIATGVRAKYITPMPGSLTNSSIDKYHNDLLTSVSHIDRLVGLCSVVYWDSLLSAIIMQESAFVGL